MAWESRNGRGAYYTRSEREGGRVVRQHIGKGPHAEFTALLDAERREEREAEREERQREQAELDIVSSDVTKLGIVVGALMWKALESVGYHNRKGEWRRRRDYANGSGVDAP